MPETTIDLKPDPRVLVAITHNPIRPMDALCELIDNAIDSFSEAKRSGHPIGEPTIMISIPKLSAIENGEGSISVLDNGIGLTLRETEEALRAGFTSHNPFDTLGVFGMGFNISTGKLGRCTLFRTSRINAAKMIEVAVDLEEIVETGSFRVPAREKQKDPPEFRGTLVQISGWWPRGSQNYGFASKLARIGAKNIREEIGRRYYSILRDDNIRIFVGNELCKPFEHCVWADHRAVQHREIGRVPAVIRFDEVLQAQVRCTKCHSIVDGTKCPRCGPSGSLRTVQERVRGWVGIQRFDDANDYGIDLIRKGRVIKRSEKEAFFYWTDARGRQIKDYPIDSIYGRIVGEVNLDHVPTDFLKQDFQRTSPEWARAVPYLRGESSLQPRIASEAGEPPNDSPIFRLYQGYRRVRDIGTRDMYMGYWESGEDRPRRISRDKERELHRRFFAREPGFYDDTEWWRFVEQADTRPTGTVKECPECAFQCLEGAEACPSCAYIFLGKSCINAQCGGKMPISATTCPKCGTSQEVKAQGRWRCAFCSRMNPPASATCIQCGRQRGEVNQLSPDFLIEHSNKNDNLSIEAFSIPLPGAVAGTSFDVDVYTVARDVSLQRHGVALPAVTVKDEGLKVFIDLQHPLFAEYQQHPESVVSMEIAKFIQDANARHMSGENAHLWSLPSLSWQICKTYWKGRLAVDPDQTRRRVEEFFEGLREALPELLQDKPKEIYASMTPQQQGEVMQNIIVNGHDARELSSLIDNGRVLSFLGNRLIVDLVGRYPSSFFDGKFWSDAYGDISMEDGEQAQRVRALVLSRYRNFLEDILGFLEFRHKDRGYTARANHTLSLLIQRLTY